IHSHIETPWGVQRLNGGGIWRFHPETKRLEVVVRGFVNPWGVHFDRYGQMFATDGAYGEGINYAFPGSVFVTAVGAKRLVAGLNPGSPKHCGLEILSGSHWPDSIRGTMVTNDFRAHRVCRFRVTDDQSGYESVQLPELIKTPHVAFRPIDAKQGLDGALYIADWYNPIIQHGEVDFRDPRRDRTHGRIWRLTHRDQRPTADESITFSDSVTKNLDRLSDDADLVRLFATQALRRQWQASAAARAEIETYTSSSMTDPTSHGLTQLQLLWLYEGLGIFHDGLRQALFEQKDGRLRAAAVHHASNQIRWISTEQSGELDASQMGPWLALGKRFVSDPHPRVRLEAVRMLAELPSPAAAELACDALALPMDRFLDFALWQTLRDLQGVWLPEFRRGTFRFGDNPAAIAFALKAVEDPSTIDAVLDMLVVSGVRSESQTPAVKLQLAQLVADLGTGAQLAKLVDYFHSRDGVFANATEQQRGTFLMNFAESAFRRKEKVPVSSSSVQALLAKATKAIEQDGAIDRIDPQILEAAAVLHAMGRWQIPEARAAFLDWAGNPAVANRLRQAAVVGLSNFPDDEVRSKLKAWAHDPNTAVASRAIGVLLDIDIPSASELLVARLSDESVAPAFIPMVSFWLSRRDGTAAIMNALRDRTLAPNVARQVKAELRKMNAPSELMALIDTVGKLQENRWQLTEELRDQWLKLAMQQGDPTHGETIYRRSELQCIQCHRIGGVGGLVGPDLTSIGAQAPADYLLEALLNPAAKVKEGYNAKLVRTDNDEVLAGIPVRESDDEVVLRLADNREISIDKSSIVDIKESRSLMPDGLLDSLTEKEAVDLLRFIVELGKLDGTMLVKNDGAIRAWEALAWSDRAFTQFNRTSFDSIAGDQSIFTWQLHPSLVSGAVPMAGLAKYRPHPGVPEHTFLKTKWTITRSGNIGLDVSGIPKGSLSLWVDGKPLPIDGDLVVVPVNEGESIWYIGVNREIVNDAAISLKLAPDQTTAKFAAP
ncbi:MAG: sorbosone dehydrogenase, partial [Pirellula sp.]|nr:sorbosone dehydrogenase [Pirellula sp.]